MLAYVSKAQKNLQSLQPASVREKEASWFMKVSWNLALQAGEHYHEMREFFVSCHQVRPQLVYPILHLSLSTVLVTSQRVQHVSWFYDSLAISPLRVCLLVICLSVCLSQ